MDVIGAGFGRTGTTSLQQALELLLDGPCFHMTEIVASPALVGVWTDALAGREVDWESVFAGYRATVDFPGCLFVEELMAAFPEAKVVLTVRDPLEWYRSMQAMVAAGWRANETTSPRDALDEMIVEAVFDGVFKGRFDDVDFVSRTFTAHIDRVQAIVPPDRLLTYDVRAGWGPLCAFLGVAEPNAAFPWHNSIEDVETRWGLRDTTGNAP